MRTNSVSMVLAAALVMAATFAALPGSPKAEGGATGTFRRVRVLGTVPKFRLQSADGSSFGSKQLEGKVWIATFIFTRCGNTCPTQSAEIARLQKALGSHPRAADIRFVSITVDPVHDTPDVLREYAARVGADPGRWSFLTGSREEIWSLSKEGFHLPVEAGPSENGILSHAQSFILVDRALRMRGYYDALNGRELARLREDLDPVLEDPPGPIFYSEETGPSKMDGNRAYVPEEVRDVPWLKERAAAQARTVDRFRVFHDFRFTDRRPESGITFRNRVVDDGGKAFKGVHYDHGNGIAVADVDSDGRPDIYFLNQLGGNQLWRNRGDGTFEDITAKAGVSVPDRVSVAASFADVDNDGDPDLYVTAVREGNVFFENDGHGLFKDITAISGLGYRGHSSGAVFFDYDRDGFVDLFLCNVGRYTTDRKGPGGYYVGFEDAFAGHLFPERNEASVLYHNQGNRHFEDVSRAMDLVHTGYTGAASPVDFNEDGWPDLYVLNMQGRDEYYENDGGRRFVRRGGALFPETPWGEMGIKSFDFDNDGDMDLFITDMHTDMTDRFQHVQRFWYAEKMKMTERYPIRYLNTDGNHILGNAFFLNEGGGRFREISDDIGAETYWPWGLSVGDLNADGWQDVFITAGMNYSFRYGVNSLLLNNEGREFLDSEFLLGVEPRRDGRTSTHWFDIDCSKAPDNATFGECQGNRGRYEVYAALGSRASVMLDLDADGDLDIVTNDFNSEPMVLVSDLTARAPRVNFLQVRLVGKASNRDGLGARVRVTAEGHTWTQVMDGQSGYLSQSVLPLYFGLGKVRSIDRVEVSWPSSPAPQVLRGPIKANEVLTIQEP